MSVRIRYDAARNETFAVEGSTVRVFNATAMETYSVTLDPALGAAYDLAVDPNGDLLVLCMAPERQPGAAAFVIQRCNYRGEPKSTITPQVPAELSSFVPTFMEVHDGRFYFVNGLELRSVVLRADGGFVGTTDLAPLLEIDDKERGTVEIGGFAFGPRGEMVFTIPEHFKVAIVSPAGAVATFGTPGSGPGKFGVVGGVTTDSQGNLFVADKQRSVVMMFDSNRRFVSEFGEYGERPENLIRPDRLVMTPTGKLFVSQMRQRGVSVFEIAVQ